VADQLTEAFERFLTLCPHVVSSHDLVTKIRLELGRGYVFDLYFREATGQYSYTLLRYDQRLLGWDNASHHPGLDNHPHHFHRPDGSVESAPLTGDPVKDMDRVAQTINTFIASP
jgi:Family of unknown function (DUF6516)